MTSYLNAMRNSAVFRGRASRAEFWRFLLVYLLIAFAAALLDQALGTATAESGLLLALVQLIHLLPQLSVLVRRLHDSDRTGWWWLVAFTGVGVLLLLVFACLRGTPGPSRYGPAAAPTAPTHGPAQTADHLAGRSASDHPGAASPPDRRDVIAEIERLAELRASGSLSEAEFEALKVKALSQGRLT